MRSNTRTGTPLRANKEAVKSPAADPPTTATFWLFERELELESLFATRDSSTSLPQQESNSAVEHVSQAESLDGDAALATHVSLPQAPAGVPSHPEIQARKYILMP